MNPILDGRRGQWGCHLCPWHCPEWQSSPNYKNKGLVANSNQGQHHNNNLCFFPLSLFLQPFHGNYFDICSVPACFASWGFKEDLTLWWEGRQTKNASLMLRAEGSESSMLRVPWEVQWMWHSMCIYHISAHSLHSYFAEGVALFTAYMMAPLWS